MLVSKASFDWNVFSSLYPNYVLIDKNKLLGNIKYLSAELGNISAVVKCDAYGHGIENVVPIIDEYCDSYCVIDNQDAKKVRRYSAKQIYRIRTGTKNEIIDSVVNGVGICELVGNRRHATIINDVNTSHSVNVPVHIMLNHTGLGREGFTDRGLSLSKMKGIFFKLKVVAITSHLPGSDLKRDTVERELINSRRFLKCANDLRRVLKNGNNIKLNLFSSTSAFTIPKMLSTQEYDAFSFMRIGNLIYGLHTCQEQNLPQLKQVMSIYSIITDIEKRYKGECIGYQSEYQLEEDSCVGVLGGIGWHNMGCNYQGDVKRSKRGHLVADTMKNKYRLIGKTSMNACTFLIPNNTSTLKIGEYVALSTDEIEALSIKDISAKMDNCPQDYISITIGNSKNTKRILT